MAIEPIKIQKKERTYLSEKEVDTLINAVEHPLIKLVVQTLYYTLDLELMNVLILN